MKNRYNSKKEQIDFDLDRFKKSEENPTIPTLTFFRHFFSIFLLQDRCFAEKANSQRSPVPGLPLPYPPKTVERAVEGTALPSYLVPTTHSSGREVRKGETCPKDGRQFPDRPGSIIRLSPVHFSILLVVFSLLGSSLGIKLLFLHLQLILICWVENCALWGFQRTSHAEIRPNHNRLQLSAFRTFFLVHLSLLILMFASFLLSSTTFFLRSLLSSFFFSSFLLAQFFGSLIISSMLESIYDISFSESTEILSRTTWGSYAGIPWLQRSHPSQPRLYQSAGGLSHVGDQC